MNTFIAFSTGVGTIVSFVVCWYLALSVAIVGVVGYLVWDRYETKQRAERQGKAIKARHQKVVYRIA